MPSTSGLGAEVELSVVIPVYNERDALEPLQAELEEACARTNRSWELVWVDDGSSDGSTEVLERLARERPGVRLVRPRGKFWKSAAPPAGIDQSRGASVVTLDGDGQDTPAEIPKLLVKLDEGYDVVSGWKQRRRDPPLK